VHRRSNAKSTEVPAPGVSMEKSDLKQVAAPEPVQPDQSTPLLQPVLIVGAGVLLLLVIVAGGAQTLVRRRRELLAQSVDSASLSSLKVGKAAGDHDLFDDIPEENQ